MNIYNLIIISLLFYIFSHQDTYKFTGKFVNKDYLVLLHTLAFSVSVYLVYIKERELKEGQKKIQSLYV
jgi:hypothetical protein